MGNSNRSNALAPAIVPFALLAAVLSASPAHAGEAEFGLTGITLLETARLAAFCSEHLPGTDPCLATFEFHFARGTLAFLDLRGAEAGARGSSVEIIPCFKVLRGAAVASLEVFDSFVGRTNLLASWSGPPAPRTGEVDFSPAGITPLDTAPERFLPAGGGARAQPCAVVFVFHDMRGRVVKEVRAAIAPGASASLDLRSAELGVASRVEIIPCFKVESGAVVGSFRVLDAFTGHTNLLAYPSAPVAP